MVDPLLVATVVSTLNIAVLAVLTAIWAKNYREFRTPLVLGLLVFGLVLLAENGVAIYFFFSMKMLYAADSTVQSAVAVLRAMQFVALAFLAWATLQ
ncbi:hypothetical protein [Salinarchaeum laminariae]|uniref:hypothetical protein n=1 Tax=Salinarchaeum laminariae TaxID=869888 RepID=UPI0020BED045|nr:hypothetical protein [Salinarchaeum laminariae]